MELSDCLRCWTSEVQADKLLMELSDCFRCQMSEVQADKLLMGTAVIAAATYISDQHNTDVVSPGRRVLLANS